MQRDGLTGRVSDHLDDDRIISTRPKDHGFVRVTHFPWESPPWGPTRFDRHSEEAIEIPYGEVFEVSVWEDRETIADSYTPSCGATRACELALAVADDADLPIGPPSSGFVQMESSARDEATQRPRLPIPSGSKSSQMPSAQSRATTHGSSLSARTRPTSGFAGSRST